MDDLISRAAALDAIDSMKPMQGNMEQLAMKALCWAAIKTIQPVDAIPVEWIRGQMAICHENSAMYQTASTLLQLWRKEQEAR